MLRPCALRGLGSAHLVAPTPQAKGKIERRFGTFHRRLVTLIAHARARTWQQSEDIIQMEIARQNRTVNRTLGKAPLEIWETQSLREEGRMRPAPSAALLDLHISLRCSRRVNHDHTIDFDDRNYDITPPLSARSSPSCIIHVSVSGSSNSPQRTFGPRSSAISLSATCPVLLRQEIRF